jgi:hypothetical protein
VKDSRKDPNGLIVYVSFSIRIASLPLTQPSLADHMTSPDGFFPWNSVGTASDESSENSDHISFSRDTISHFLLQQK